MKRLLRGETDAILKYEGRLRTSSDDELEVLSQGRVTIFDHDLQLINTCMDIT